MFQKQIPLNCPRSSVIGYLSEIMGYATIIDLVGSIIIGGMLLGIILKLSNAASWNVYSNSGELNCQTSLTGMSLMLENDFRKIDYCEDYTNIYFRCEQEWYYRHNILLPGSRNRT